MSTLGRYELLRPLARGGMAEVYLARRRVAGVEKRLVIKRLRKDRSRDPRFLELFMKEAQLSMSLVQQNIVPVFDFGRVGDDVFLAMEHIDGKDLGSSLAKERGVGMSPLLAAFVAVECCQALDHAHRRPEHVIHRDVTARNVLLSWAGEVKLADFGIAAVVGDASGALGTPGYMAPEQARGDAADARVDIYALGIVLWEMLLGDHVRPADDRVQTIAVAKSGELPEIDPEKIPDALAVIIRHATAKDPGERYATARNMAEALDEFLLAERARDPGPAPAQRLAEWLKTRWGDLKDEPSAPIQTPGGAMVSFLDDGADKVGARTMRSIMETAADDELRTPPAHQIIEDAPADRDSRPMPVYADDQKPKQPPTPRQPSIMGVPERRLTPLLLVLLLAAAVTIGVLLWMRSRPVAQTQRDAAVVMQDATTDGAVDAAPDATPDAAIDAAPDAAIDAPIKVVAPRIDAQAGELRPITIGAIPWANFTVDNDPKVYETPQTLKLTVGPHRVTFSNKEHGIFGRTVTVIVPAEGDARHVEKMN